MFSGNTRYRQDRKLCSIGLLFCCSFFSHLVVLFFPTADAVFSFSIVHVAGFCSTVSLQTKLYTPFSSRSHGEMGLILFSPGTSGQQPSTNPVPVYADCCYETITIHTHTHIYIYIYMYRTMEINPMIYECINVAVHLPSPNGGVISLLVHWPSCFVAYVLGWHE